MHAVMSIHSNLKRGLFPIITLNYRRLIRFLIFLQVLHLAIGQTCPSDQTPTDALGPFYVAATPLSTVIGPEELLQDPSNRLEVSGNVLSAQDCTKGLAGITIEIWYAGSEGYRDDEYRGMFVTEECGKYNYTQTFPFLYSGRPLHVHIRASRGTEELLVTQMYFVGQEFGFQASRSLQAVEIMEADDGSRSVRFDVFLHVEGDGSENCSQSISSPVASQPASDAEPPVVAPIEALLDESLPSTSASEPTVISLAYTPLANLVRIVASSSCLVLLLSTWMV